MRLCSLLLTLTVLSVSCSSNGDNAARQEQESSSGHNAESVTPEPNAELSIDRLPGAGPVGSCSYFSAEVAASYRDHEDLALPAAAAILGGDPDALLDALEASPQERPFGIEPLVLASSLGCIELMEALIDHGIEPGGSSEALAAAFGSGNLPAAQLLMDHRADLLALIAPDEPAAPFSNTRRNEGPVGSCSYFNPNAIDYHRNWEDFELPSVQAIANADAEALSAAMQANPNERPFRDTPLVLASGTGCTELMTLLIDIGGDVNQPGFTTPLTAATAAGNLAAVQLLLDHGADPNLTDNSKDGSRPLGTAAYWDLPEVIELLLEAGADLHGTNAYGSTALSSAGSGNSVSAATVLLDAGLSLTANDLRNAISSDSIDFIRLIAGRGHLDELSDTERKELADRAERIGAASDIVTMLDPNE